LNPWGSIGVADLHTDTFSAKKDERMNDRHPYVTRSLSILALLSGLAAIGCELDDGEVPITEESVESAEFDASAGPRPGTAGQRKFVPNRVIVRFRDGVGAARQAAVMQPDGFRARQLRTLGTGAALWSLETDEPVAFSSVADEERFMLAAIEELREQPEIEYIHEDAYLQYSATPNDTYYNQQWNYPSARFPKAWDTTTGMASVKIAVLDSGRLDHPDLSGRWTTGYNAVTGSADAYDHGTYHHGLHVAGVLGARANNGQGVAATCWNCPLMPVRVSDASDAPVMSAVDDGIVWAANNGARVINMSFGTVANSGTTCANYPDLQAALNYARSMGVVLVAAAGNDSGGDTATVSPAGCTGVLAVGATTTAGLSAVYSNKGARVDVVAPGGNLNNLPNYWERFFGALIGCPADPSLPASGTGGVISTWATSKPKNQLTSADYCYRHLSGTSLAAPHVAGLAALIMSERPTWTVTQVVDRIKNTATPVLGCATGCGKGLIHAAAAVGPPTPAAGLWYNPARAGTGVEIHARPAQNKLSIAWLTYTTAERPIWYYADLNPNIDVWEGTLTKRTWNGSAASTQNVGTAKLRRVSGQWYYEWTLGSSSGNEPLQQLVFGAGATKMDLTGLWQNNQQPGWFLEATSKGSTHVLNLLAYDQSGQPTWLQGVGESASTSVTFPMMFITGKNLCPGCVGPTSYSGQAAGTVTVQGALGKPTSVYATTSVSFPGGTWNRPGFTGTRVTGL
jgi:serine protease